MERFNEFSSDIVGYCFPASRGLNFYHLFELLPLLEFVLYQKIPEVFLSARTSIRVAVFLGIELLDFFAKPVIRALALPDEMKFL